MSSEPRKPVDTPDFWHYRLLWSHATGRGLHTAIFDIDPDTWNEIQNTTAGLLQRHLAPGMRLLDAGCGYGAAYDLVPRGVSYVGVDLSPELVEIARLRRPEGSFAVGNLSKLDYADGEFDFALCRSMKQMVVDNLGMSRWCEIERELLRVAKRLLVIEYEDMQGYQIIGG